MAVAVVVLPQQALAQACTSPNADADFIMGSSQGMDDTVMNVPSGLVWKRCMAGQTLSGGTCVGPPSLKVWGSFANDDALLPKGYDGQGPFGITVPVTHNLLASGAWRMPYQNELQTLTNNGCPDTAPGVPEINQTVFPNAHAEQTWTATHNGASRAFQVNFNNGGSSGVDHVTASALRMVRGGQPFASLAPGMDKQGTTGSTVVMGAFTLATDTGAGESWGGAILTGDGNPEFQINGAGPWLSRGIVKSGDVLTVRITAAAAVATEHVATLELVSNQTISGGGGPAASTRFRSTATLKLMAEAAKTTVGVPSLSAPGVWLASLLLVGAGLRRLRTRV